MVSQSSSRASSTLSNKTSMPVGKHLKHGCTLVQKMILCPRKPCVPWVKKKLCAQVKLLTFCLISKNGTEKSTISFFQIQLMEKKKLLGGCFLGQTQSHLSISKVENSSMKHPLSM